MSNPTQQEEINMCDKLLTCTQIAKLIGSKHTCNKRKTKKNGRKQKYQIFSTKNQDDMQVLWALLCKKKKLSEKDTDYTCRLLRGNMNEIENTFGSSHFEMCADFSKRLKASVRMEPPRARTRQNENLVQDGGGETENNHFVLSDDDDSDAVFICNLLHTPTAITPSVSTTTTNTTTSTPSSSTSQKSNNQPEMLIRRRSPRTNNQSSSQNLQPSSLNFTNTNQEQSSTRKKRSSRIDTFMEQWSETEKNLKFSCKKKFGHLSRTVHGERTTMALCYVLTLAGYDTSNTDSSLSNNSSLYEDVTMLLTSTKALLMKLTGLTDQVARRQNDDDDLGEDEELSALGNLVALDTVVEENNDEEEKENLEEARATCECILAQKMARDNYNKVVKTINAASKLGLKSYHLLSKDLPPVTEFECSYVSNADQLTISQDLTQALNDDDMVTNVHMPDSDANNTADDEALSSTPPAADDTTTKCDGAYVSIDDCIRIILNRVHGVVEKKGSMEEAMKDAFLIFCGDGAQHPRLQTKDCNIITYSITLSSPYLVKQCGYFPTSGNNILPHLQLRGKENVYTLRSALQFRIRDMENCLRSNPLLKDCAVYEIADGKALYLLLDHTHWQSNNHPYLLCKCIRFSDGPCAGMLSDAEYSDLMKLSRAQWDQRDQWTEERKEFGDGTPYTVSVHRKWIAEENFGVSHFGALPVEFKISQIRFDIFHGRSGIVKVVLKYIRNLFEGIPANVTRFSAFLKKLPNWDGYVIDPWVSNASNSRIKGRHSSAFINNIPQCITILQTLMPGILMNSLCSSLTSFYTMAKILGMVIIDDYKLVRHILPPDLSVNNESGEKEIAEAVIELYKSCASNFCEKGLRSFMTNSQRGDKESFYSHTLSCYLPQMLKETYERHNLGLGIFSMEGFEYKNYTSKQVLNNRTNGKLRTNIVMQSLRILQLLFKCSYFNPEAEVKRRRVLNEKRIEEYNSYVAAVDNNNLSGDDSNIDGISNLITEV